MQSYSKIVRYSIKLLEVSLLCVSTQQSDKYFARAVRSPVTLAVEFAVLPPVKFSDTKLGGGGGYSIHLVEQQSSPH